MRHTAPNRKSPLRLLAFALSLVFIALSFTTTTAAPSAAAEIDEPILFGAHPSQRGDETRVDAATNLQSTLGGNLGIVRRYFRWEDTAVADPLVDWTISEGAIPHISVYPRRENGDIVAWADIASAEPGSQVDTELRNWAREIADLEVPVWFTFNHEPETTHNEIFGTDEEFVAAWRHVVDVFEEEGATNVEHLWVMTAFSFSRPADDRRFAEKWYPGDAWVDQIGADPYNWTDCRLDVTTPWKTLENLMTPVRDFAALHPDKGLVVAEFGSAEDPDDSGRKAEWVNEIRRLVRDPEWSQLTALIAFNARHPDHETPCEWWVDSNPETLEAYQGLLDDPAFGGDGSPPPPPPEQAALTCSATVLEDSVKLDWDPTEGRDIIRRDDAYRASASTGSTSYTDTSPPNTAVSYSVRSWIDNVFTDIDCGTVDLTDNTPELPCSTTVEGSEVTIEWDDTETREILRKDNSWLTSPAADATSFTYPDEVGTHTYQLRTWGTGGQYTDTDCGSITIDNTDAPVCSVTLDGSTIAVTWEGTDGKVVLRRNGSWRNTPADEETSFVDTNLEPGDYDYSIRVWLHGAATDTNCGSATIG